MELPTRPTITRGAKEILAQKYFFKIFFLVLKAGQD